MVALTERQKAPVAVSIVFSIVATVAVILRVYARRVKRTPLESNDYCIFTALTLLYGLLACDLTVVIAGGAGLHMVEVIDIKGPQAVAIFLKNLIAIQILWAASLMFVKISILLFYMRIFAVQTFRTAARVIMVLVVVWTITVILAGLLICRPFAYNWDQTIKTGSCGNRVLSYVLTGAFNICTDVIVLVLPIPIIWNLQTPRANKVALTGIFGLGFFVCIVSIIRLVMLVKISYVDTTYTTIEALIWSMLEPALGITPACLPIMRPLFVGIFPSRSPKHTGGINDGGFSNRYSESLKSLGLKKFQRLEENAYPLRVIERNVTTRGISRNVKFDDSNDMYHYHIHSDKSQQASRHASEPAGPLSGINVKTEWEVHHDQSLPLTKLLLDGRETSLGFRRWPNKGIQYSFVYNVR